MTTPAPPQDGQARRDLPEALLSSTPYTLLIDNFDSFTWNLYQYLCMIGATVVVVRNNELTQEDFPKLNIANLIVSPGPGHPQTDSGISRDAIRYFAGKVPVLGVCMGLECFVDEYGGEIAYAGEIMHGKTSKVRHDGKGIFKGVTQGILCTRYHSLSASHTTLPDSIAITATTEESGVIMGVRHRELTVESVQYHPESIMSDQGSALLKNFLELKGGRWEENPESNVLDARIPPFDIHPTTPASAKKLPTILEKIHAQRLKDVEQAKATPGTTPADLSTLLSLHLAPPLIPLVPRIRGRTPALMAEIKRASPSKGIISLTTNAAQQALTYALAGASVISVLTEPTWFKGSLLDMRLVRQAIDSLPNRPAVLRKDFIIDEYQISEARLHGADAVLLIVAMLPIHRLQQLYKFSVSLGMEPLVEVNNAEEMKAALDIGAKVIGVNNRNLHDFEVDMGTTTRLATMCQERDVILCALSGISGPADVRKYVAQGVGAVLVGESLMRSEDPTAFIRQLLDLPHPAPKGASPTPLVKICGIRSKEMALVAAEAGADMIGLVFARGSKRAVDLGTAREISLAIRNYRASLATTNALPASQPPVSGLPVLGSTTQLPTRWFTSRAESFPPTRPLVVGVFQDQTLEEIAQIVASAQLDLVQLHGSEPIHWANHISVPVIKAFHLPAAPTSPSAEGPNGALEPTPLGLQELGRPGYHNYILLDSLRPGANISGGSGLPADWPMARKLTERGEGVPLPKETQPTACTAGDGEASQQLPLARLPIILAGGLTPENVKEAVELVGPWAVDVSGGVETKKDGSAAAEKDGEKIRAFIRAAKGE